MRHRITQALDSPQSPIGDTGFIGVQMRLDPSIVPTGYASLAINMRFRNGIAETRRGFIIPPWLNRISGGHVLSWGTVYGIGEFRDPTTGTDWTLIAADGNVYYTTENMSPLSLTLPAGETVTTTSTFTQAFDSVIMFRGSDTEPLAMAGIGTGFEEIDETPNAITRTLTEATVVMPRDHYFSNGDTVIISGADQPEYNGSQTITSVPNSTTFTYEVSGTPDETATGPIRVSGDGTEPIPNSDRGLFFQNRVLIPNDGDELAVSDFGVYTKYLPVVQELRINVGSSDTLKTIAKFNDTTVIAFKEHSIYALSNFYRDLSQLQQDTVTDEFGLVASDSVAKCGADLLFLSQMGVMSLRQTEQNKIQGVTVPLSDPIQPLIDRINWRYAQNAQAAYWDSKYYLAVPLDDAEMLGPELVPPSALIFTDPVIDVTPGETYRFVLGNATSLVNGSETLTASDDFVAQSTVVGITKPEGFCTSSLRRVTTGVNNAILIYDFLNQAWCGHDEASGLTVKKFHIRKCRDVDRLFVVTNDGYILMYEEDYTDQLLFPYVDVVVSVRPDVGNTITVNGGTTVTVQAGSFNTALLWGRGDTAAEAARALFVPPANSWGYYTHAGTGTWTAPNTQPLQISGGVRFLSSDGSLPEVALTGANEPTLYENTRQEVVSTLVTRGYTPDLGAELSYFDWLSFDAQTWNPDYTVTLVMDGVSEESVVASSITKDRSKYTVFGRADYDTTNVNFDSELPYREDYSVLFGEGEDTQSLLLDTSSVDVSRHQQTREEFKVRKRGRSARVKFVSSQGRIRLLSCKLQSRSAQTNAGSKVS